MSMFFLRPDFLRLLKSLKTDEDLQYSVETSRSISMWHSWDKRLTKPFKLITHFPEISRDSLDSARLFDLWSIIWSQSATSHLLLGRARFMAQLSSALFAISYSFRGGNMALNPVEVPKFVFGFICSCSNCNYHCNDHIFTQKFVFPQFTSYSCFIPFTGWTQQTGHLHISHNAPYLPTPTPHKFCTTLVFHFSWVL